MKDVALRLLKVVVWTIALPIVGYVIFGIFTIIPLLGILFGPYLLAFIYAAGAAPAFVTAAGFELVFRRWGLSRSLLATVALGVVMTLAWAGAWGMLPNLVRPQNYYVVFALMVAGALPSAIIPVAHFAKDRRHYG